MARFDMRPRVRPVLAVGLCALLLACSTTPTPYQALDQRYGYSEQQIEDDRYRVSFAGNAATPRDVVQNYMLYRAAELTVQGGHDYFTVVDQQIEGSSDGIASPRVGVGVGSAGSDVGLGVGLSTFLGGNGSARYTAFSDIIVRDGAKPAGDPNSYDARDILRRLEPQLQRPAA
jgi:hypothetical protein